MNGSLAELRYIIATGELTFPGGFDAMQFTCYSGKGMWQNDPESTDVRGLGPIPVGVYRLGSPRQHPRLGPLAFPLNPLPGTDTLGRSGFYIHGDNARGDRSASSGCIILHRTGREAVARLVRAVVTDLHVIPR